MIWCIIPQKLSLNPWVFFQSFVKHFLSKGKSARFWLNFRVVWYLKFFIKTNTCLHQMCICTHIRRYHSKMKRTYKYFDKMFDNKLICNILISGWQGASSTYGTSTCIKTKLVKENKNQEINLSNNCKVLLLLFVRYLLLDMSYTRHTVI